MIKGCLSLISGLLALIGLFLIFKDCGFLKAPPSTTSISQQQKQIEVQSNPVSTKTDSNEENFTEVKSIIVRNKVIKVGDKLDDVYAILKPVDRIKEPDMVRNPSMSIRPVITQHYEVDGKIFDLVIVLLKENDPYRIGKILLKPMQKLGQSLSNENKTDTEWTVPQNIPKFKVSAKCGSFLNIVVSPNTTNEELKLLIYAFRDARINNAFNKMIPKTSESRINNGYAKVFIQVFTEPQWASEDKLRIVCGKGPMPNNPQERMKNIKFNDEYNKHIKAYYDYEVGPNNSWGESGSIGYAELGQKYSSNYEQLFSKSLLDSLKIPNTSPSK